MKLFVHLKLWRDICDEIRAEMKGDIRHERFGSCGERKSSKMFHFKGLATAPCPPPWKNEANGELLFCNNKKNKMVAIK